jgi:hypothetical protein
MHGEFSRFDLCGHTLQRSRAAREGKGLKLACTIPEHQSLQLGISKQNLKCRHQVLAPQPRHIERNHNHQWRIAMLQRRENAAQRALLHRVDRLAVEELMPRRMFPTRRRHEQRLSWPIDHIKEKLQNRLTFDLQERLGKSHSRAAPSGENGERGAAKIERISHADNRLNYWKETKKPNRFGLKETMKLRLCGNSIRLRLTPAEVAMLCRNGAVGEVTHIDERSRLEYRLESNARIEQIGATLEGASIIVRLPKSMADEWAANEQVGISHLQPLTGGGSLTILIEKDFECLHSDETEEGVVLYPNPRYAK